MVDRSCIGRSRFYGRSPQIKTGETILVTNRDEVVAEVRPAYRRLRLAASVRNRHLGRMTERALPLALRRRQDREAIREDIAPYLSTSVAQRSEILAALCRLAAEQIAARPDGPRVLQHQDPRSPDSEQRWLQLIEVGR